MVKGVFGTRDTCNVMEAAVAGLQRGTSVIEMNDADQAHSWNESNSPNLVCFSFLREGFLRQHRHDYSRESGVVARGRCSGHQNSSTILAWVPRFAAGGVRVPR